MGEQEDAVEKARKTLEDAPAKLGGNVSPQVSEAWAARILHAIAILGGAHMNELRDAAQRYLDAANANYRDSRNVARSFRDAAWATVAIAALALFWSMGNLYLK